MKNKLLSFYDLEVRARRLIYCHMPLVFWTFVFSGLLIIPIVALMWIWYFTEKKWLDGSIIITIILISFLFFIHKRFDIRARTILNSKFSIKSPKGKWMENFHQIQVHMITEYLIENEMYTKWKIEKLMEAYKEDNKNEKMPPLIAPSILIAAIAPNLNYLLKYFYEQKDYKTIEGQIAIFVITIFFSILMIIAISFWKNLFQEISEIFVYKKVGRRKNLISILDDILMTIKE